MRSRKLDCRKSLANTQQEDRIYLYVGGMLEVAWSKDMLQFQHSLFGTHHSLVAGNIPAAINPFGYFDGSEFT